MALSTQAYKEEALDLHRQGLSLRGIEAEISRRNDGRRVVSYLTIRNWVLENAQKSSDLRCIQQA